MTKFMQVVLKKILKYFVILNFFWSPIQMYFFYDLKNANKIIVCFLIKNSSKSLEYLSKIKSN